MQQNQLTVTMVVGFVGFIGLLMGCGIVWLIHDGVTDAALLAIPSTLAGSAVTGLVALLARTEAALPKPPPAPVVVDNPPPVPVVPPVPPAEVPA